MAPKKPTPRAGFLTLLVRLLKWQSVKRAISINQLHLLRRSHRRECEGVRRSGCADLGKSLCSVCLFHPPFISLDCVLALCHRLDNAISPALRFHPREGWGRKGQAPTLQALYKTTNKNSDHQVLTSLVVSKWPGSPLAKCTFFSFLMLAQQRTTTCCSVSPSSSLLLGGAEGSALLMHRACHHNNTSALSLL